MRIPNAVLSCWLVASWLGCAGKTASPGGERQLEPGNGVTVTLSPAAQAEQTEVTTALEAVASLTAETIAAKYRVPFATNLGYDPTAAKGLELIQASPLKLAIDELDALRTRGFAISARHQFPTFAHGYQTIYMADLPLYVSADSILEGVHRSYDDVLKLVETAALIPDLRSVLSAMRASLARAPVDQATADADVYVAVALGLLDGQLALPVAGGDGPTIADLYRLASTHDGAREVVLFGVARDEDFSQFKPRGHYAEDPTLTRYFQSMMWLGRIDFRMIETQPDGQQIFRRRQVEAALRLRDLLNEISREEWARIDATIRAFVGEPDYMILPQLDALLADLGVTKSAELATISDERIAQAIVAGRYGTQRISSHIMVNGLGTKTLPLSSSFAFFGQRYVVDSHVFSNVVWDRVHRNVNKRMLPDPLDAAFAALGNDQAVTLLGDDLAKFAYAPDLAAMRVLADAHGSDFWRANLYNLWLTADRALSPSAELADPPKAGLPSVFATEAWGRRLLSAQLASWAELRHDTILYAKQSYTSGVTCEFPDAYVDPYPAFYVALRDYAERGSELVGGLRFRTDGVAARIQTYFATLAQVSDMLKQMADAERAGTPFTVEQMEFINRAVHLQGGGCGGPPTFDGWYAQLFFSVEHGAEYDPTIADVHTQPTDEAGATVGKVLHVGTGMPRLMVVSVDSCNGPRAYAGLVSTYLEQVTEGFKRLDDSTWAKQLTASPPPDVRWMKDLVQR